jgi:hypothetical protein
MRAIRNLATILLLSLVSACIKPYTPVIEGAESNKLVVAGKISGTEGWQEVNVSLSSPVENNSYIPLSGCEVNIFDNNGNIFAANEMKEGSYQVWMSQNDLLPGTAYMVSIVTPDGERVESAYDTLTECPPLDSVYYIIEDIPTSDPDVFQRGMQFYTDLHGGVSDSRFYNWTVRETWEFHSARPLEHYYDGRWHDVIPPDYSLMVCWANILVKDVFLVSTKNFSQNLSLKNPLHFIDGHTSRLSIMYSILVTQQSLTESTYHYFEVVKSNSSGFAGLYEQQPFSIKGNLQNLSHPDQDVLGYFYACSENSKRYFYQDIEGLELDFWDNCNEGPLPISGWGGYKKYAYPVYYYYDESGALLILSDECVDCRIRGGSLAKPDFWPL